MTEETSLLLTIVIFIGATFLINSIVWGIL